MRFNKLIPELIVSNFDKSLLFYTKVLGFKVEYKRSEDKFAFLSLEKSQIMIEQEHSSWMTGELEQPFGRGINFQIEVKSIKPLVTRITKNKIHLFEKPHDKWYRKGKMLVGNRQFLVQDPDGYLLRFCEDLGTKKIVEKNN